MPGQSQQCGDPDVELEFGQPHAESQAPSQAAALLASQPQGPSLTGPSHAGSAYDRDRERLREEFSAA
eukprot:2783494-Rhodomonas_salina.3